MNRIYKYLLSLLSICFVFCPMLGQTSQWSSDGNWPVIVDDSVMIIGPKVDSLTEEQRYFNPVYLMVYPGKESLTQQMVRACICDCDTSLSNPRIGIFSVGGDRRVSFSKGNLQYLPAANLWKFADNQYDYIGNSNKYIKYSYRNWVDLFGWSASNTTAPFGVSRSTDVADYSGSFLDWGINAICGDEPGIWRTLTKNEWEYLLNKRTDAKKLRGLAQVNGVNGIIFLPDDWVEIPELVFKPITSDYSQQSFTIQQWLLFEQHGAVFLPAAGRRDGNALLNQNDYGNYWSMIRENDRFADYFAFTSSDMYVDARQEIHIGRSVRLVYDTVIPEAIDLGLSVKWASFNLGAKAPEDFGVFYAWGETTTKSKFTIANYQYCDGKITQLTKYCTNADYGQIDNRVLLEPSDDAAVQQWADDWRMPTDEEWYELLSSSNTKWDWMTINGVNGYRITSKIAGYTDKSIFLPAAGYRTSSTSHNVGNYGYYWSSSVFTGDPDGAWRIHISATEKYRSQSSQNRYYGFSIRPVNGAQKLTTPTVQTIAATQIKDNSALLGGKVSRDGGALVTEYGVVYSTEKTPTTDDNKITSNSGIGQFYITLENLQPHTTYYARAFASNSHGTAYGTEVSFTTSIITTDTSGIDNGHAYVDLGLPSGTLWATTNVGAATPEQSGDYFAWGETQPKTIYNSSTYIFSDAKGKTFYKYNTDASKGVIDNKTNLDSIDDAASVNWGSTWRTPTYVELSELNSNCIWVWTSVNGVKGQRVTSKKNGNSIFLPATGYMSGKTHSNYGMIGYYQSSSLRTHIADNAYYFYFRSSYVGTSSVVRQYGLTVRPVLGKQNLSKPSVTTYSAMNVRETEAIVSGCVTSDGGANIIEHGVVYGLKKNPTIENQKVISHDDLTKFYCQLPNLIKDTLYYARAYATNSQGTSYGAQVTFSTINHQTTEPTLTDSGFGYVDLGLSVMWATCNIGATATEQHGDYYAWGEIEPKNNYNWKTYKWCNNSDTALTKYCVNSKYGIVDDKVLLDHEDDAASVLWGASWHMPTDEEWTELRTQCTWYWICKNDVNGYKVVGKNGNSIFLPISGYRLDKEYYDNETSGCYWSKSLHADFSRYTHCVIFDAAKIDKYYNGRCCGQVIRPVCPPPAPLAPAKRIGIFSVASDRQVSFSQGNLQYTQSTKTWQFADNQYDYIGEDNIKDGQLANRIDLFGWSGVNSNAPWGVSTSSNIADYVGDFLDWGTNTISGDEPGLWRLLSADEWHYLLHLRPNANELFAEAIVNSIPGLIILPDNWQSIDGIPFLPSVQSGMKQVINPQHTCRYQDYFADEAQGADHYQDNQYTVDQWNQLEAAGAVFLPAAGWREKNGYYTFEGTPPAMNAGVYWSSTKLDSKNVLFFRHCDSEIGNCFNDAIYRGRSVRLVHDTIVPPPAPYETFEVNGVTFNMMCVEGGTFMMGATENDTEAENDEYPQHQVTVSDFMIGQTEVPQQLWQAVMSSNPSKFVGDKLPVESISWADCQLFVQKLNALTGMYFRLPTEAEWEYAARGGQKSRGYKYAGSDNLDEVAWMESNSGNKTHNIGTKLPNELGIYDMTGNVWEWCADEHARYTEEPQINPFLTEESHIKNLRGGSWHNDKPTVVNRISNRSGWNSTQQSNFVGLRLVLDYHTYVDLGLSVMWATTNVGAKTPEEYGDYFAWGETQPKDTYTWNNYMWSDGSITSRNKYCTNKHYGIVDDNSTINPTDDAATIYYNNEWRTPTYSEWSELINECSWEWISINGINGYKVTSKKSGYTEKYIFIPAAGYRSNSLSNLGSAGRYWSSSLFIGEPDESWPMIFTASGRNLSHDYNFYGASIRPVYGKPQMTKPTLSTIAATQVTDTSALVGGKLAFDGNTKILEYGVVYGTSPHPTIADHKIVSNEGMGLYLVHLTNLQKNTTYYVRAYATNAQGIAYGTEECFTTGSFAPVDTSGIHTNYAYVDLGLSVQWATTNIGASVPEEFGYYFAWGEIEPKDEYSWSTYKWSNSDGSIFTKYNANQSMGIVDNKNVLGLEDDAARMNWGGDWRMPTLEEWQELYTQCVWVWTTQNGVKGHKITSKTNGNSIFIPAAGRKSNNKVDLGGLFGCYVTSTLVSHNSSYSYYIYCGTSYAYEYSNARFVGHPIRPVCEIQPK